VKYLLACIIIFPLKLFSQVSNCGDTIPVLVCPENNFVCIDQHTAPVLIDTSSNLPDLEYFIVDVNVINSGGFGQPGPVIIGATTTNQFRPSDFGITDTTTLKLVPVAFDASIVQQFIDTILINFSDTTPCCEFPFIDLICDGLALANINEGSDFTNLSQALTIFGLDTIPLSQSDLIALIDLLNVFFTQPGLFPDVCGGGGTIGQICFAEGAPWEYNVVVPSEKVMLAPPEHQKSIDILADTIFSSAQIMNGDLVCYHSVLWTAVAIYLKLSTMKHFESTGEFHFMTV
jgi:hypothetical protein